MQHNLRRLGELRDFAVAKDDPDVRGWGVRTRDGREIGEVDELIVDPAALKVRYLEVDLDRTSLGLGDNRRVSIPVESAEIDRHRHTVLVDGFSRDALAAMPPSEYSSGAVRTADDAYARADRETGREPALSRAEEEMRIGTRERHGEVVVGKHLETEHVREPVTVEREQVRVERRPVTGDAVNREVRMENGEIRIPVTEEEIVVEKRPVVKEEIVVSKETVHETRHVEDDLRKERFDVRDERGRVVTQRDGTRRGRGGE